MQGEKRRLNLIEMKCFKRMCGVTVMDRIWNEVIMGKIGVMRGLAGREENCVMRWFGHIECMDGEDSKKDI